MAFVNREVEYPGRIMLTDVSDDSVLGTFDVERAEGTVTEEGTPLTADNLNSEITDAVNSGVSSALETYEEALDIDSNSNVHVRNIQMGMATITPTAAKQTKSLTVKFPKAFTKAPQVVVTPNVTVPANVSVSVAGVSTTQFTIYVYRTTNTATAVRWIALI